MGWIDLFEVLIQIAVLEMGNMSTVIHTRFKVAIKKTTNVYPI